MEILEQYRQLLLEKEREIIELQKASAESEKPVSLDEPIGRLTRIDAIQRQQQALHSKGRNENNLQAVQDALNRIEDGTYGQCKKCNTSIDPERLEFLPETTLCMGCIRAMRGS